MVAFCASFPHENGGTPGWGVSASIAPIETVLRFRAKGVDWLVEHHVALNTKHYTIPGYPLNGTGTTTLAASSANRRAWAVFSVVNQFARRSIQYQRPTFETSIYRKIYALQEIRLHCPSAVKQVWPNGRFGHCKTLPRPFRPLVACGSLSIGSRDVIMWSGKVTPMCLRSF